MVYEIQLLVARAYRTADQLTLTQLIFLAITLKLSAHYITSGRTRPVAYVVGGIVLCLYFFHRFTFRDEFSSLVDTFMRSFLLHQSGVSVTQVVAAIVAAVERYSWNTRRLMKKTIVKCAKWFFLKLISIFQRPPKSIPAPPIHVPTYEERLQGFAQKVTDEHNAEIQMLDSLPLDRDEREVLEIHAKRKLLKRLRER